MPAAWVDRSGAVVGVGRSCGTFGELLQGVLPDGRRFLVTLPLARYSTARFTPGGTGEVQVLPSHKEKSRQVACRLLEHFGVTQGGLLSLDSELPEGKGLGSSSADMVASALAVQAACGRSVSPHQLAEWMAQVVPSDGVMFPGVVSFYHQQGRLRRILGTLPPLTIVGVDEGGTVDTVAFNRQGNRWPDPVRRTYEQLLLRMEQAVIDRDLQAVGDCATQSAVLHQRVLPKANLDWFLELRSRYGALGVVVAHSGTYIGLLMDPSEVDHDRRLSALTAELSGRLPALRIERTDPG
ncbi:MAG: kinase [Bacillota bacterium]